MILFVIVDFGMIFSAKSKLENESQDIVSLLNNNETLYNIKNIYPDLDISLSTIGDNVKITIKDYVDIKTPGLNRVLEDPYPILVERIIPNG